MHPIRLIPVCFATLLFVSGCATYIYDGQTFDSAEAAKAAQIADMQAITDNIDPLDEPIWDELIVGIPSKDVLQERGIVLMGSSPLIGTDHILDVTHIFFDSVVSALKKRNLAQKIIVRTTDGTDLQAPDSQGVYVLMVEYGQSDWYFVDSNGERTYLEMDPYRQKDDEKIDEILYLLETM